jgi:protein gp37
MAEITKISWAMHTMNFWLGCSKISPECAHCYIDRQLRKMGREPWGQLYKTSDQMWRGPGKWETKALRRDKALRIFTCSLSDFFHRDADQWRPDAWRIMRSTPHLVWLVLTKRPGRILSHLPPDWGEGYPNVWLGVSTGCRKTLVLTDVLRRVPAAVRFISAEPLLEPIAHEINLTDFQWVITGGESGPGPEYLWPGTNWQHEREPGRRTMQLQWAKDLRDAAHAVGTRFFFKQITSYRSGEGEEALGQPYHEFPAGPFPWYRERELLEDFGT